jgi:hypothetical protein
MSIVDTGRADPLMGALKLLADPVELERRYAALREAEEQANSVIALAGPASQILTMRRQIEEELAAAKAALGDARMQASLLVDTARQKAQEIEAEARAKQEENDAAIVAIRLEEEQALATAKANMAAADSLKKEYLSKLVAVDNAKEQVEAETDALRGARVAFENRLAAMNDVIEQFRSALQAV